VNIFSRFGRPKQTDQLSEPINRAQSKSLRDVFEKAILRGDVAIYSPGISLNTVLHSQSICLVISLCCISLNNSHVSYFIEDEDSGVMRNPSFITASLPRPDKHKQKSATIGGDNYMHIGECNMCQHVHIGEYNMCQHVHISECNMCQHGHIGEYNTCQHVHIGEYNMCQLHACR